jgi:RecA-family ATPase
VVPGLIPEDGAFLLFAPSGHYKTTLMLLILVLAANGQGLDGSAIDPVPLIIVANEDAHGTKLRLRALAKLHGLSLDNVRVQATRGTACATSCAAASPAPSCWRTRPGPPPTGPSCR